jgi:methionyl-tRNA formyltransferase
LSPRTDGLHRAASGLGGSRVRTVFLGSGAFAVPILRLLATHPSVAVVGVVTAPPRPVGRARIPTRTQVHDLASSLAVDTILTPTRLRDDAIDDILTLEADLVVLADYGRIVPPALLAPRFGALNVHPSLLPRHRGATPIPAAILAGDPMTGVTLMRMDAGLDTGPIIAQTRWALDGDETTPELEAALADEGARLLGATLDPWLAGELEPSLQAAEGATLTRPLRRDDGRLDPARPAAELERQIRAYQPWPGTFVVTPVGRLVLWSAVPERPDGAPPRGTFDDRGLGVGDGERLRLVEVQPAGGTRMPWEAFVRGRSGIVGGSIVG